MLDDYRVMIYCLTNGKSALTLMVSRDCIFISWIELQTYCIVYSYIFIIVMENLLMTQ
jgi:hypothetical protein